MIRQNVAKRDVDSQRLAGRDYRPRWRFGVATGLWLCAGLVVAQVDPRETLALTDATPLDHYVHAPDPNYEFELVASRDGDGVTTHVVRMQSQAWLSQAEVDRPVWWHWLVIVEPDEVRYDKAMLFIGGGSNDDDEPTTATNLLLPIAKGTGSIVAELRQVPNQPLRFAGDDQGPRVEDAIIAFGWDQFLRGGARDHDATWLARLPMTKAAVRAMDTVQAVSEELGHTIETFVVAGGSKRGWTTWTTAAVDARVEAIVPLVIDLLNVEPSFDHHWRAYGFWSPAVVDYKQQGIMEWQGRSEYSRLLEITEPYSYRDRLTLPKYLVNASGDEFFLPDSWQFYWEDLVGEKHLRAVPNAGHSLDGSDAVSSVGAFYQLVLDERPRPSLEWRVEGSAIEVVVDSEWTPSGVTLWRATNPKTRDFRVVRIRKTWESLELEPVAPGRYRVELDLPEDGWQAGFIEATFPVGEFEFKVTSGVHVVPSILPFGAYVPDPSTLP